MKPHEAIRFARKRAQLTQEQVAGELGVSRAAVAQWEQGPPKGTLPEPDKWSRLATLFKCTIDELVRGPVDNKSKWNVEEPSPARSLLPLVSWVNAGLREEAFDPYEPGNADEWIEFTGPFSRRSICLRVRGHSMTSPDGTEPTFPDGSYVGIEVERMPLSGEFAVFRFNNSNEASFKRFVRDGPLQLLVPLAQGYPIITLTDDAQLVGTVTEKRIITRY